MWELSTHRLTELRVHPDGLLNVFECLGESNKLHIRCRSVVVSPRIARIALDTLRVALDSVGKLASLELRIALLTSEVALLRVDICLSVSFRFNAFDVTEFIEDVGGAVFGERFVVELDGGGMIALLDVRRSNTSKRFGN